ncbi:hypothetical protein STVA_43120 [Allostella vacuolata]|nr:hypothetical protein STVA_43120 [Stella vacuolata]
MRSRYRVVPLTKARAPQAYPLVQGHFPGLSLSAWRAEVARRLRVLSLPSGVLVVEGEQGYLVGIAMYRTERTAVGGRALVVDCFLALSLVDRRGVAAALLEGLMQVARSGGCGEISAFVRCERGADIRSLPVDAIFAATFEQAGYGAGGFVFRKPLT